MKSKELRKICVFTWAIITITVILGLITGLILEYFDSKEVIKSIEELRQETLVANRLEWKRLSEINEDIIGWIEINGTDINYPILKCNNLYYLRHNYNKTYNLNGSIYTNGDLSFKEKETVLYGVSMKNDLMFSELDNYLEKDFLDSHNNFFIYTPENTYKATVIGCYSATEKLNFVSACTENIVKLCSYSYDDTVNYLIASIEKV